MAGGKGGPSRDEFPQRVKDTLAKGVGLRCSLPNCDQVTSGPHSDPDKSINVGVAAHITAAAEGGPRYDRALSPAQRRSAANGIWACATHGTLIDTDPTRYTVEQLRQWKAIAEAAQTARVEGKRDHPREAHAAATRAEPVSELQRLAQSMQVEARLATAMQGAEGIERANQAFAGLCATMVRFRDEVQGLDVEHDASRCFVRYDAFTLVFHWYLPIGLAADKARLFRELWRGHIRLQTGIPIRKPEKLSERELSFGLTPTLHPGWRQGRGPLVATEGLAAESLQQLFRQARSAKRDTC